MRTSVSEGAPAAGFSLIELARDGQLLLPLLDLINDAQCAIDDLIDVMGRATPPMSAVQLAGRNSGRT